MDSREGMPVTSAESDLAAVVGAQPAGGHHGGRVLAWAAAAVALALAATRPLALRWRDRAVARGALRYGGGLVPAALAAFGLTAAARLIIQHDLGATAVARYSIAFNVGAAPMLLLDVLDVSWMPRIFALAGARVRGAVLAASRDGVYALLAPAVVGLSAGAPLVLAAWAPPSYRPGGLLLIVALLAASALPLAGTMAATRILLLHGRTATVGALTVIAGAATIALTALLVPVLKLDGAALATLAGYALQHALLARAAHAIEPLRRPPRALVAKCAAAAALALASTQLPGGPAPVAARALVALACVALFAALALQLIVPDRHPRARALARWARLDPPRG